MNKALPVKQVNIGKYVSHFNDKEVNVYKGFNNNNNNNNNNEDYLYSAQSLKRL